MLNFPFDHNLSIFIAIPVLERKKMWKEKVRIMKGIREHVKKTAFLAEVPDKILN